MTATPRRDPRSPGARLAAKLQKPRRTVRPRPKRPTRLNLEARRVIADVKLAYAEQQIEQMPGGADLLRLNDERTKARFHEQFAALAFGAAHEDAERARKHHQRVCNQLRYAEYEQAHRALRDAEARQSQAKRLHGEAVTAHGRASAELRLWIDALAR